MLAVRTPGAPRATRSVARPAIPPSPLRDRVGYSDHVRFRGYFPVHFIPAYNLPVYASRWPLPDTTQDSVRGCSLGFTAAAISGDGDQRTCKAQLSQNRICGPRVRLFGSLYQNTKTSCSESSTGFNRAGDGSCRDLALRFVQQVGAPVGCIRHARLPAPIRAVGEYEAQLTVTRLSQSISPFAPLIFTSFLARTKRSDFCMRIGMVVVASFQPTAHADPCRSPRVRTLNVLPLPASIPLRSRLDFGRCVPWHAHPIGPACPRLHLRSVLQPASGFFPTRPRGARAWRLTTAIPACSCLQLAVATNSLRRGLSPPIQCPCLAHKGGPAAPASGD